MTVRVEFYGIARQRAGVASTDVEGHCLGDVLQNAGVRLPGLAQACLDGPRLQSGYLASINGKDFTRNPETPLDDGDSVLILSADAGG